MKKKRITMLLLALGMATMVGCGTGTADEPGNEPSASVLQEASESGTDQKERSEEERKVAVSPDRDAKKVAEKDTVSREASGEAKALQVNEKKETQTATRQSQETLESSRSGQNTAKKAESSEGKDASPKEGASGEETADTPVVTPTPSVEAPTPEPIPEPTPEPIPEPTPQPTPAPEPESTPVPEPAAPAVPEPAPDAVPSGEVIEQPQEPVTPEPVAPASGFDTAKADELAALINAEREARGVGSVTIKDSLVEKAKEKAQNGGSGSGVMICRGTGATSASIVADSWRADWPDGTWMTTNWKYVGVACYANGGNYTWVAVFGAY